MTSVAVETSQKFAQISFRVLRNYEVANNSRTNEDIIAHANRKETEDIIAHANREKEKLTHSYSRYCLWITISFVPLQLWLKAICIEIVVECDWPI